MRFFHTSMLFDRTELGISILSDSTSERIELSQLAPSIFSSAFACEDPSKSKYVNFIDSVNIFTKFNFDNSHPAGSKINDIVKTNGYYGRNH